MTSNTKVAYIMNTISLRLSDDDYNLIKSYASANSMTLTALIRDAVIDRIEDDLALDEERIQAARKAMANEKTYSHEEVWEMMGV